MIQKTFAIIKPDAVERRLTGQILASMEEADLRVVAMKLLHLTREQAEHFYGVHKGKPFYETLVTFMTSGPVVCLVLEGEDAVARYRALMGSTDPATAAEGTLRRRFAKTMQANSVHGSDSAENAIFEISCFFSNMDMVHYEHDA